MGIIENLLFFIFLFLALNIFVKIFIRHLLNLSFYFRISYFLAAFIFGGLTTSLPELLIAIQSAIKKINTLSLGNLLGSNITDMSLILGISLLLILFKKEQKFQEISFHLTSKEFLATILVSFTPFILTLNGYFGRIESIVTLTIFFLYFYFLYKENKIKVETKSESINFRQFFLSLLAVIFSCFLITVLSYLIVNESAIILNKLNISTIGFGALILSLGTTLPEMIFSFQTLKKGLPDFVIGNLVGSVAINSNFILGIAGLINPFVIEEIFKLVINLIFLFLVMIINFYFISHKRFNLIFASWLLLLWLVYAVFNFLFLIFKF